MLPRWSQPSQFDAQCDHPHMVTATGRFDCQAQSLRFPQAQDLDQLLAIERRCFRSHRFIRQDFQYHLRNPASIFAVSESSNKVVGYILGIVYHGSRRRIARLYSLAVLPKSRTRGIGTLLLNYFHDEAKKEK